MSGRLFYGWWVVLGSFAVCFIGFGSAYTFSTFLDPLQREFAASRGSISLVFSIAGFLYFALGMLSGPLSDRFGVRPFMVLGVLLVSAGLVTAGFAHSLWQVYAGYGLGIGCGVGSAYVPSLGAVQRWFSVRRGLASGIAVSGIGVGTLVLPPVASFLIGSVGWRQAYIDLGVFAALAGVAACLPVVDDPARRGLAPDGAALPQGRAPAAAAGVELRRAVVSPAFFALYAACLVASFGLFVPFVHLVPYALDHHVPRGQAVMLLGMIGVGSTVGRFFLGGLADRVGRINSLLIMFLGMGLAQLVWANSSAFWALAAFALSYGFFQGGFVAILPALVMDLFGGRHVSGILGVLFTSVAVGTLVGPTLAGYAYDVNHSYLLPILGAVAANMVAARILAGMARAQRRARESA